MCVSYLTNQSLEVEREIYRNSSSGHEEGDDQKFSSVADMEISKLSRMRFVDRTCASPICSFFV